MFFTCAWLAFLRSFQIIFHYKIWGIFMFQVGCFYFKHLVYVTTSKKGEKDKGTEKRTKDDAGSLLKAMPISGRKAEERNKY
jgi:hypothetical protein